MSITRNEQARGVFYDVGLRNYLAKVYNYMALALGVTGLVAFFMPSILFNLGLFQGSHSSLFFIASLSTIALAFYMQFRLPFLSVQKLTALFFAFPVLVGISLVPFLMMYTTEDVARAFFITAMMFGSMALYGNNTKKDLTGIGSFFIMGVWGIIIASIVNLFLGSGPLEFAISFVSVVVFTVLTAYDAQRIRDLYYSHNDGSESITSRLAILGALNLYFDFINMFTSILRLFNLRSRD